MKIEVGRAQLLGAKGGKKEVLPERAIFRSYHESSE